MKTLGNIYSLLSAFKQLLILICCVIVFSCGHEHEELLQTLISVDSNIMPTGHYVVIPNQGCEGCISTAENFVKANITKSNNVKYIFTRISSIKRLKVKLGHEVVMSKKVILDTANSITYPDAKNQIYPMIISLKDGQINGVSYQSPTSEGLQELVEDNDSPDI